MHGISEADGLVSGQFPQQLLIERNERGLFFSRDNAWQGPGLAVPEPRSGQKFEVAGTVILQTEFSRDVDSDLNR